MLSSLLLSHAVCVLLLSLLSTVSGGNNSAVQQGNFSAGQNGNPPYVLNAQEPYVSIPLAGNYIFQYLLVSLIVAIVSQSSLGFIMVNSFETYFLW